MHDGGAWGECPGCPSGAVSDGDVASCLRDALCSRYTGPGVRPPPECTLPPPAVQRGGAPAWVAGIAAGVLAGAMGAALACRAFAARRWGPASGCATVAAAAAASFAWFLVSIGMTLLSKVRAAMDWNERRAHAHAHTHATQTRIQMRAQAHKCAHTQIHTHTHAHTHTRTRTRVTRDYNTHLRPRRRSGS